MATEKNDKKKTNPVSFSPELFNKIEPFTTLLDRSKKRFVEKCVEAICELAEQPPDQRRVPGVVIEIDDAKTRRDRLAKFSQLNQTKSEASEKEAKRTASNALNAARGGDGPTETTPSRNPKVDRGSKTK